MKYDYEIHHRRSIRLKKYDYSKTGFYFITLCTHQKQYLFGEIVKDEMRLNQIGRVVRQEWLKSVNIRQEIELDEWIIMPNHLHGIVIINKNDNIKNQLILIRAQALRPYGVNQNLSRLLWLALNRL